MFDNLCKSWPRGSQQCINRLKNKQTSYRVLNTVLIKVLYERCGSWPQKCYGDGYSTGWLRHFIATRRYEFFNFRSAEARSAYSHPTDFILITYIGQLLQTFDKYNSVWLWVQGAIQPSPRFHFNQLFYVCDLFQTLIRIILCDCVCKGHTAIPQISL